MAFVSMKSKPNNNNNKNRISHGAWTTEFAARKSCGLLTGSFGIIQQIGRAHV